MLMVAQQCSGGSCSVIPPQMSLSVSRGGFIPQPPYNPSLFSVYVQPPITQSYAPVNRTYTTTFPQTVDNRAFYWTSYHGMSLHVFGRKLSNGMIEWEPDHMVNQHELAAAHNRMMRR